MRILVLAYFYPPYVAAGATRAGELVRHWRLAGADVEVVAARTRDLPSFGPNPVDVRWSDPFDVNALPRVLLRRDVARIGYDLPGSGLRHRLARHAGEAFRQLVHFPDAQVGWLPAARRAATIAISRHRPDVIFSTSPPATAHLVAAGLSSAYGIPWVAELRDAWTTNPHRRRWPVLRRAEAVLERQTLRSAAALVGITPGLARSYRGSHSRVETIPNGFSPDEYPDAVDREDALFLHVGTVYPGYRLDLLFEALHAELLPRPRVAFIGRRLAPLHDAIARLGAPPGLEIHPPVSRPDALAAMKRARANLAFIMRGESGELLAEYAQQKFYEYIGAGRPIIAIGPEAGDGAELLASSGLARFADDVSSVRRLLMDRSWDPLPSSDAGEYAYPSIASRYMDLFRSVSPS